ncbi:MAG: UbiA-like polyprenyltransferase [Candidatus Caenarcaniphilales bacterium]|nr:UbiA-like polyprenyltransferase [Candidatus Caenarcaniphilales bacterium]
MILIEKLKTWAEMIKLEHTIFSAPFLLSAMLLASYPRLPHLETFLWVGLALLGARSAAMTLNRILDASYDALNPRTAARAIPAGKLSPLTAWILALVGFLTLGIAAWNLPPLCLKLLPVAIIWLSFYSFTKRFTWLCHWVLGIALGGAVLGGWIAVTGTLSNWLPILLALAVCFWVAGFDIIYALQDLDFDRSQKLLSVPAQFGREKAIWISRISHLLSVFWLAGANWVLVCAGSLALFPFLIASLVLLVGLMFEHYLLVKKPHQIDQIFFTANAWISSLFFLVLLVGNLINSPKI